ncbi:TPA: hypothetical protein N0F65_006381 [Lagenidium giganteum]|uniref:PH domain-containing protein n=1 Tax=Lagenidium giganteum TaxID=4803 RepID=A0AAV2YXC7_9STRA|nr:TPA: hypothetical protein N0F65_006381 [Lagenidium giganteum]
MPRDDAVTYAGWVYKEGSVVKSWKKRFLVVKRTELAYYKNTSQGDRAQLLGAMRVASIERAPDITNGLLIYSAEGRALKLFTDTADECEKCYRAISMYCAGNQRAASSNGHGSHDGGFTVNKAGWLNKEGQTFKTWKKRYFVLNQNMISYSAGIGSEALGQGRVLGARRDGSRALTLVVTLEGGRELRIEGRSESDIDGWHTALRSGIQQSHAQRTSESHAAHAPPQYNQAPPSRPSARDLAPPVPQPAYQARPQHNRSPEKPKQARPQLQPLQVPEPAVVNTESTSADDDSPRENQEAGITSFRRHIMLEMNVENPRFVEFDQEKDKPTKPFSPKAPGEDTIRKMRYELRAQEEDGVGPVPVDTETVRRLNLAEQLLEEKARMKKTAAMNGISEDGPIAARQASFHAGNGNGGMAAPCCCVVM